MCLASFELCVANPCSEMIFNANTVSYKEKDMGENSRKA